MNQIQKDNFYSNFDYFTKKLNLRKTDIEQEANVSQGYLSRFIKNEDPNSFPSVSFLEYSSRKFGVAIDDLLNCRFENISETEESIYRFVLKLIRDTQNDKRLWQILTFGELHNNAQNSPDNIWNGFTTRLKQRRPDDGTDLETFGLFYLPASEAIEICRVNSDIYRCVLNDYSAVILIPVQTTRPMNKQVTTEWTLWMEFSSPNYFGSPQCIARGNNGYFNFLLPSLERLKNIIVDRKTHLQLRPETKTILDWFINGEPAESSPFNFLPSNITTDDLPL